METRKYPAPNQLQYKKLKLLSLVISIVVLALIGFMRRTKIDLGIDFSILPMVNAISNTIVAICLVLAFLAIKSKNWTRHRNYIYGAMAFSGLFLLTYVLYHFTTQETTYCHESGRTLYYILLASHIILAGVSLPFILLTFSRGFTFMIDEHRKMAKWVFPIWLYVAITGPICYLMLKDCYPS
jgi:putative membrane protein